MTELERAVANLRQVQADLAWLRSGPAHHVCVAKLAIPDVVTRAESAVLAALSWVWDAQQREIIREGEEALAVLLDQARHGLKVVMPAEAFAALDAAR